jgi:hypothetical protein
VTWDHGEAFVTNPGNPSARIIIAVPGPWTTLQQVGEALTRARSDLALAGERLTEKRMAVAVLELRAGDPDPVEAFRQANADACLDEADLAQLAGRRQMLYATHLEPSFEAAYQVLRAGTALLDAGGLAVTVVSANLAHSAGHWRALAARHEPADLYRALVRLVIDDEAGHSCGMHNFGLPDVMSRLGVPARSGAEVPARSPDEAVMRLLDSFNAYLLLEAPGLADGHTFSPDEWSPWYRLAWRADSYHPAGDPCHNPYGVWELVLQPN